MTVMSGGSNPSIPTFMPQLDPFVVCESSVSLLLFFWISIFLFVYILVPLVKLRFVIVSEKNSSDKAEKTSLPFYGKISKFNETLYSA